MAEGITHGFNLRVERFTERSLVEDVTGHCCGLPCHAGWRGLTLGNRDGVSRGRARHIRGSSCTGAWRLGGGRLSTCRRR